MTLAATAPANAAASSIGSNGGEGTDATVDATASIRNVVGLVDFTVESRCAATFVELTFGTPDGPVTFAIMPGAVRGVHKQGLKHLGLWHLPATSFGLAVVVGAIDPCVYADVDYLILANGKIHASPCGQPG